MLTLVRRLWRALFHPIAPGFRKTEDGYTLRAKIVD